MLNEIVVKAIWRQQQVAVKLFPIDHDDNIQNTEIRIEFQHEVELMTTLIHANIISLYGVSMNKRRVGVIMEYCENGSLRSYLIRNNISWQAKLQILIDICKGMQFLHGRDMVHRDLKSKYYPLFFNF